MRGDRERVIDILDAIDRIEKYASKGRPLFEEDELVQNWFVSNLLVIGEAASRISDDLRENHPETPWSQIIGMRNILVHGYFKIDVEVVWTVVEKDLPPLKALLASLLDSL